MGRSLREEDVFQAIAHPLRRQILVQLMKGEKNASDLAAPFDVTAAAVSQQLGVLKKVGLISEERVGRQRVYQLNPKPLKEVFDWVEFFEKFWLGKLDALGEHLKRKHGPK